MLWSLVTGLMGPAEIDLATGTLKEEQERT